ncbi:MAG: hypothetical protein M3Z26_18300 [Bacteroidota bacterium]|nr:hypothetical protein [Bacteroidota bacterium]
MRAHPSSQFVVGSFVRLVADGPVHRVIWRGKLPMPHYSDWPGEIAVYRLDNDYWDCYYEYQLQPAQPWENNPLSHKTGS